MTDLAFCYLHMTKNDLLILDTIETDDYLDGELSDEELDIPSHMIPPDIEKTENGDTFLPNKMHPSYPYGNPTLLSHVASRPKGKWDPLSRTLLEDLKFGGAGGPGPGWEELALDQLLPHDEKRDENERAALARKLATGAGGGGGATQGQGGVAQTEDEGGEDAGQGGAAQTEGEGGEDEGQGGAAQTEGEDGEDEEDEDEDEEGNREGEEVSEVDASMDGEDEDRVSLNGVL